MELDDNTIIVEENVKVENTPANTLALLLIERYSKSLHRLQDLQEVSSTSSINTIFATIAEAREMVDSVRQMETDFKKVLPEYEGSSRLVYSDWFVKFCGPDWPLYFNVSASTEEIKRVFIPRKFRAEYAQNLESIGKTLDDITHSLAFVFGFEKVNYLALRDCFTPEARGKNDGLFNRLILPEIRALRGDGLKLYEWGAVAFIIQDSEAATDELSNKSFDSWCKEFFTLLQIPFKPGSIPRKQGSKRISNDWKFSKLVQVLNTIANT